MLSRISNRDLSAETNRPGQSDIIIIIIIIIIIMGQEGSEGVRRTLQLLIKPSGTKKKD